MLLYTQLAPRTGLDKNTLQNLADTGECVVNIVNVDLLGKMNLTSTSLGAEESEFDHANIEHIVSQKVTVLSVAEAPVRYECTLRETLSISESPGDGTVVFLDVKSINVCDDLYIDGTIDQARINSVGKMGGDGYYMSEKYLELGRP